MRLGPVASLVLCISCGEPAPFIAVTFNTGTTEGLAHDALPDDGYGSEQAVLSDTWYGDGLAWSAVVEQTRAYLGAVAPDVIGFQEIFYSPECEMIPAEARPGFVCEFWKPGDPTVAQVILGEGYQVACHPGKSDKCLAVKTSFGRFAGCEGDFCLEGLQGERVEGCGGGARVGKGVVERSDGERLVVVNVHGSSGFSEEDQNCRTAQFEQAFAALESEADANLLLGDLNTDPFRLFSGDPSADTFRRLAAAKRMNFISDAGTEAPPTYAGLLSIDHVLGDRLEGACWAAGVSEGRSAVSEQVYFDHRPIVCEVQAPK